ncbi:DUF3592 domain-containing protein [Ruminococcus sp.]|jgi:hypothetical protein|uniref:DUF3592 domain-containing protein n=1 Tax=Ruminococcus sp. TaxID=41978 RepID=UPI0025E81DAC|nr:DUF3592 domain-containing protein [Ruminococcus sp.]
MTILMLIFPIILFVVGVWGIIDIIIKKKRCTEYVDAVVVDIEKKRNTKRRRHISYSYFPVFEYRFEGKDYMKRSSLYSPYLSFSIGERVGLYIDPDKPENFYCPQETIHKVIIYLICIAVGALIKFLFC